jgi:hypothetical protein
MILQQHSLLKAFGVGLVATAKRVEQLNGMQTATIKMIAHLIGDPAKSKDLLDSVSCMESESDALSCQIEQLEESLKRLN